MARNCPGIDSLRKEMVSYELRIRGEEDEGTVPELMSRLRGALGKPINISGDTTGEVATNLALVEAWLSEFPKSLTSPESLTPRQLERLRAHLVHISSRVEDLGTLSSDVKMSARLDKVRSQVGKLSREMLALGSDRDLGGKGAEREPLLDSGLLTERPAAGSLVQTPVVSIGFANLPNPILSVFKGIERLSITTKEGIKEVLWLLVELEQHMSTFRVSPEVLWALLYPLTESNLKVLVSKAMREGSSVMDFRQQLIRSELPFRWYRELQERYLWRVQGRNESLREYMDRVRVASLALIPDTSEEVVVANIIEGMMPQYRTPLLVLRQPVGWNQLIAKVKEIEKFALIDEQRSRGDRDGGGGRPLDQNPNGGSTAGKVRRCYRCGSRDHLVRQCPVPRQDR